MSTQKAVIETSFAKESGYGNPVFSKLAAAKNADYITALFGPRKEIGEEDIIDKIQTPLEHQASRDALLQDSVYENQNGGGGPDGQSHPASRKLVKPKGQTKVFET